MILYTDRTGGNENDTAAHGDCHRRRRTHDLWPRVVFRSRCHVAPQFHAYCQGPASVTSTVTITITVTKSKKPLNFVERS